MKSVLFIGLGVMGYPMAGHLARQGYKLTVYNRSKEKSQRWLSHYDGIMVENPAATIENQDFVISCVGNDQDIRSLYLKDFQLISKAKENTIFIDHSTSSAEIAKECYQEAKKYNCHYIDAPVSGGEQGAIDGKLSIMAGGNELAFNKSLDLLKCYSKNAVLIGKSGSGQLCKMANQICLAGLIQSLSEALFFAEKSGLDIDNVLSAISKGAAQSWQMDNRAKTMSEGKFDFGFAVEWMVKDLNLCKDEAQRKELELPILNQVEKYYQELIKRDHKRWDTSSLIELLRNPK